MAARNRRYPIDNSSATERFLDCSPRMRDGHQMTTRGGLFQWTISLLEDVDYGDYQTTDDKQQVVLAAPRPVSFPKYAAVKIVNPMLSTYSFRNERGETISGITIYVDDVVAADSEVGEAA